MIFSSLVSMAYGLSSSVSSLTPIQKNMMMMKRNQICNHHPFDSYSRKSHLSNYYHPSDSTRRRTFILSNTFKSDDNESSENAEYKISNRNKRTKRNNQASPIKKRPTMETALCIIPPGEAWDDIQRARHVAHDPSFYKWPPAIRLFHPFLPKSSLTDAASSISDFIEKYDIQPFNITLDHLVILPHLEFIETIEKNRKSLPDQALDDDYEYEYCDEENSKNADGERMMMRRKKLTIEERQVQELIEKEEQKGKQKLKKRLEKIEKQKKELIRNGMEDVVSSQPSQSSQYSPNSKKSPRQIFQEQAQANKEFNGPCVLCLEPDEESQVQVQALREILRKKLFYDYDPFSPSITVSEGIGKNSNSFSLPKSILEKHGLWEDQNESDSNNDNRTKKRNSTRQKKKKEGSTFRPLITLGSFSTVTKAVESARSLQQLWEPLTFTVSDLQLVSSTSYNNFGDSMPKNQILEEDNDDPYGIKVGEDGTPILHENREFALRQFHGTASSASRDSESLMANGEYGCDAIIMLMGEEEQLLQPSITELEVDNNDDISELDDKSGGFLGKDEEDQIFDLLLSEAGTPGGQYTASTAGEALFIDQEQPHGEENEDNSELLEDWLSDDDDYEEGATVIIGRTQFFMGDMRLYEGMPASSTIDGKDKMIGDRISGSARRRGAVHRQGDRWNDGDFGRKQKDIMP